MIGALFAIPGIGAAAMSIQEANFPEGQRVSKTKILEGSKKIVFFQNQNSEEHHDSEVLINGLSQTYKCASQNVNSRVTIYTYFSRWFCSAKTFHFSIKHHRRKEKKVFKDTRTQRYKAKLKIWPWRASDLAEYVPARQPAGQTDSIAHQRTRPPNCGSALRLAPRRPDSRLKNNQPARNNNSSESGAPDELKENKKREAAAYPPPARSTDGAIEGHSGRIEVLKKVRRPGTM